VQRSIAATLLILLAARQPCTRRRLRRMGRADRSRPLPIASGKCTHWHISVPLTGPLKRNFCTR